MDSGQRIEKALQDSVSRAGGLGSPPQLAAALRYAVFPGGARVRPRLCLAVARACGDPFPAVSNAAAASIELLHCASLVHDDLPCFDDAGTRRGKPSVHKAFSEPLAVLAGDALIVLAFQTLAHAVSDAPDRLGGLIMIVSRAVGGPLGIVAGQAWECEPSVPLSDYHRAKTGSLFAAATIAGALAAGGEPESWRRLGECLGEAFQVADDICDLIADPRERGKPSRQDEAHARPNAAEALGLNGAGQRLEALLEEAAQSIPVCPGARQLRLALELESRPFLPKGFSLRAA
jgi:geranylgeranyl diphosphate synthase, type II